MDHTTKHPAAPLAERLVAAEAALAQIGAMVSPHLSKLSIPNVSTVKSLDEMYECSLWAVIDDCRATTRAIGKIVCDYQNPSNNESPKTTDNTTL